MSRLPNGTAAAELVGPRLGHCGSGTGPPADCRPLVWPTPLTLKKFGIAPPQQGFWYWKTVPEPVGSVATDPPTVPKGTGFQLRLPVVRMLEAAVGAPAPEPFVAWA